MRRLYFIVLAVLVSGAATAQTFAESGSIINETIVCNPLNYASSTTDSIGKEPEFDTPAAWSYIDAAIRDNRLWRLDDDTLRESLRRLLNQTAEPYDTTHQRLSIENFRNIPVHSGDPELEKTIEIKWINDSTFIINPQGWSSKLYMKKEPSLVYPVDFSKLTLFDSSLFTPDTVMVEVIDTVALQSLEIALHYFKEGKITPPLSKAPESGSAQLSKDLSRVNYYASGTTWIADENSPFRMLKGAHYLDSLHYAVHALLDFTEERDSSLLLINDMYGQKTPLWITTGSDNAYRFWVKNYNNDSITLWVGNPASNEISLLLEDDVNFSRLVKEEIHHLPSFIEEPQRSLRTMPLLEPEHIYWDYEFSSILTISQTYLANWTKGGESSFTSLMDLAGRATYNNTDAKTQWVNLGRIKFGNIWTDDKGCRKNHDQFEIDSRFNRNAWGKIGMSASFYMKNQLAKGYDFPNDSIPVSKFLNPGTITLGLGAEYKPIKNTSINIAPLSYKTTFTLDTAGIVDHTKHGIPEDQWAKRELGTQIAIYNKISPMKGLEIINRMRLFSNYLHKPQNVDVDWEMVLEKKINWFFTVRLNLHLIYDDDIKFPVLDGSAKKVSKAQFKEFVGLAVSIKF